MENLHKRFGELVAVQSLTLSIPRGEIFGLLGPNGSGKTTTIRMLTGLMPPTSGRRDRGRDRCGEATRRRCASGIGYMSQRFGLYDDLTVEENLRFYAGVYGLRRREGRTRRIEEQLVDLGFGRAAEADWPARSRGGWKQRLALGLRHRPPARPALPRRADRRRRSRRPAAVLGADQRLRRRAAPPSW